MSIAPKCKRPYGTLVKLWDSVLYPILSTAKPKKIVEIGSDFGHNTEKLLHFCHLNDCELHSIDPAPRFNAAGLYKKYGERLHVHKEKSVDALPNIEGYDLVIIDGDHNWYTVHSELTLIEEYAEEQGTFPLIILHDTGWPYGRRDMYHVPEFIPKEYRKPHAKKGLIPQEKELQEVVGMNSFLCNSITEGGEKSGVLTAVEDFLKTTSFKLSWHTIPGIHGVGILTEKETLKSNEDLSALLKEFAVNRVLTNHIEAVERDRIDTVVRLQNIERELQGTVRKMKEAQKEASYFSERDRDQRAKIVMQEKELREFQSAIQRSEHLYSDLCKHQNNVLNSKSWRLTSPLRWLEDKRRGLTRLLRRR